MQVPRNLRAGGRIKDSLANLRVHNLDDGTYHLARREELTAIVVFLAHLQKQALVSLRERGRAGFA